MAYAAATGRYSCGMDYRRCGRSGVKLSAFSLGFWHNFGDVGDFEVSKAIMERAFDRMHLDYVDVFYSHRFDPETPLEETLQALVDIVRQGKALYAGASCYPADALAFDWASTAFR